jgi:hypothetical protein
MEDLARYLEEIVDPTIEDFEQHPTSVRYAFLACVAVFHSVDYLAYPRRARSLRQRFGSESTSFKVVDQVAHAFKHVQSQGRDGSRLIAREVIYRPPAIWGVMEWGLSRWDDSIGGVTLERDRAIDLLDVVKRARAFLGGKIAQLPPKRP